jgi:hypothetical protein
MARFASVVPGGNVEAAMITLTLTIDFGPAGQPRYENRLTLHEKSTVLDALMSAVAVVTLPRYGMDHFVDAIDGVNNQFELDLGWRFEVNGYGSSVPAERYLVKNGDWINWFYVKGSCR